MKNNKASIPRGTYRGSSLLPMHLDRGLIPASVDLSNVKQVKQYLESVMVIDDPKISLIPGGFKMEFQFSHGEAQKFLHQLMKVCLLESARIKTPKEMKPCGKSAPKKRKRK